MGQSTDAILAYGIDLGEEMPPKMSEEEWDIAREQWGEKADQVRGYEIVYHMTGDDPFYFLAVPGTVTTASRGYPERVNVFGDTQHLPGIKRFWDAMHDIGVPTEKAGWQIFSMWA